ncbi:MAG: hypothetical protein PF795_01945 [Kiritimatiellae bacterium]|jgi:hypothetical protein|nr:hypothetical protein [Kiritimatiellia bacterium]
MPDDIDLDDLPDVEETQTTPKVKSATPVWMVAMVIIAFICFAATLTFQFLEYRYWRGASPSESDPYAGQTLIRSAS